MSPNRRILLNIAVTHALICTPCLAIGGFCRTSLRSIRQSRQHAQNTYEKDLEWAPELV